MRCPFVVFHRCVRCRVWSSRSKIADWPWPWSAAQSWTQLTCSDFRHHLDGLWSPERPITLDRGL
jgi:hypothetical protein